MRALQTLLVHPHVAYVQSKIIACGSRTNDHHTAFLADKSRDGKGAFARMFENQVWVVSFARDVPNSSTKLARLFKPRRILWGVYGRHLPPTIEITPVDHALSAELHNKITFTFVADHTNRISTHHTSQLHRI